jgi:acyl-CoA thioester hydrolase
MTPRPFRHRHRVTYSECTVGDHVYYGRYLDILEEARGELFRAAGVSFLQLQTSGVCFPVVECALKYRSPAHYDDLLDIEVWITRLGGVRLNFAYRVSLANGPLVLEAHSHHVCTTPDQKPKRIPGELNQQLTPFVVSLEPPHPPPRGDRLA